MLRRLRWLAIGVVFLSGASLAQDQGPFGGFKHDRTQPIEITADSLEVRQAESIAIFEGNVIAGQDTLRLTADRVEVSYDESQQDSQTGAIQKMKARGNVFLSNGTETAQGSNAEYDVVSGTVQMSGSVILTQGQNAVSGERLNIDLNTGRARMVGQTKMIFQPQSADSN